MKKFAPLLLLLLAGCQAWLTPPSSPRPLAPPFGEFREFQRDLSIRLDQGGRVDYRVRLSLTPERSRIVLTDAEERPVLTFEHGPGRTEISRTPALPAALSADALIADIQLALWPEPRLRAPLRPPWRLQRDGDTLRLYDGQTLEARVSFQEGERRATPIPVYNARYGYLMLLLPVDGSTPSPSAPAPE
ncbi:hypothetical protein Y5W_02191 [Alcanivorax sp. 521-1]|uniref:DUF3261 domain-containing protein n=1 Tax=Alloalcanivorax profundimaris TaxID=2735259 RepID=A0ABS0ARY0_9GAMM|nr:DUF3261 domain-containing protein [Alloalcanivorax profundimaris]MBF5056897.1 hypothetical protein [Alloalcanivorax profundimaris]MBU60099.1 hypothetical protein [Alcanivorax sp.]